MPKLKVICKKCLSSYRAHNFSHPDYKASKDLEERVSKQLDKLIADLEKIIEEEECVKTSI